MVIERLGQNLTTQKLFNFQYREEILLFSKAARPALGPTQPSVQCVPVSFLGVKQPRCDTDHIHPSSAKVKNGGKYNSTLPHKFITYIGTVLPLPLQKFKIRSNAVTTLTL